MEGELEDEGLCQVVVERRVVECLRQFVHGTGIRTRTETCWDRGQVVEGF